MSCPLPIASIDASKVSAPPGEFSDADAITAVLKGDRSKFEILVRRYNLRLYRVGMAYLHSHAQAEDAMQNTYLKAFTKLQNFDGASAFSTWLTRIMINECLMLIRSQKKFLTENLEPDQLSRDQDSLHSPSRDQADGEAIKSLLQQSIADLTQAHRAVYVMREVQQLSTADTAMCLGMSEANVKVSLHRAREELKSRIRGSAVGTELFSYPAVYCNAMTARVMERIMGLG